MMCVKYANAILSKKMPSECINMHYVFWTPFSPHVEEFQKFQTILLVCFYVCFGIMTENVLNIQTCLMDIIFLLKEFILQNIIQVYFNSMHIAGEYGSKGLVCTLNIVN